MRCAPPNRRTPRPGSSAPWTPWTGRRHPCSGWPSTPEQTPVGADGVSFSSFSSIRFSFASAASAATSVHRRLALLPRLLPAVPLEELRVYDLLQREVLRASRLRPAARRHARLFGARVRRFVDARAVFKSNGNACAASSSPAPAFAPPRLGSARTPSHRRAVRCIRSAFVPVTIEAPKSIGGKGLLSVFAAQRTRARRRAHALDTTSCPSARIARRREPRRAGHHDAGFVGGGARLLFSTRLSPRASRVVAFSRFVSRVDEPGPPGTW